MCLLPSLPLWLTIGSSFWGGGGGVSGLTTATALSKLAPAHVTPKIDICEIRPHPGTVGGAINLTPNALRLLDYLGVYQKIRDRRYGITVNAVEVFSIHHRNKLAESSFRGPNDEGIGSPPYKAIRITRANLMHALIATLSTYPAIILHLDHRCLSIEQSPLSDGITATFSNSSTYTGSLPLGCDGVHSFTRNSHVDPDRKQLYTGVSNAFGFLPLTDEDRTAAHFEVSALNFAPKGLLLTSYHEETRSEGYVGAIITMEDVGSRDGWKAKGEDAQGVKQDMLERFAGMNTRLPIVSDWLSRVEGWFMWPVYMVENGGAGRWSRGRAMLLGDAAHAMPPQGESTGIVIEHGVLFARCLWAKLAGRDTGVSWDPSKVTKAFEAYETLRRPRIEAACKESMAVFHSVKEMGRFGFWLKTCIIPIFLHLTRGKRQKHFEEDVTRSYLGFDGVHAEPEHAHSTVLLYSSGPWWTQDSWNPADVAKLWQAWAATTLSRLWYRIWRSRSWTTKAE
ncbi:uncharacterized protein AB675_1201 [Cyphellophora attinorum]|uniref:FAD-binding domain-containing protein n=1 Tax=Cyphellophora attinorum TaxID=1664694 RepID=A0A0N1H1K6_9EURO|nr:uncharacterized protein AB675_1201 [Phialophora attinorum]KPI38026.1 hypothetical protein AB675_1201 [Phialophora attinorum]